MNFRRTKAIARKEALHIVRDPRSLALALALPLVMLLAFGYALSLDVDKIPTVVWDHDRTPKSRELVAQFNASHYFQLLGDAESYRAIEREIDTSRCLLALVVPQDYAKDLMAGREVQVQLLVDGSDSNTAAIALAYADALVQGYAAELRAAAMNRSGAPEMKQLVEPRIRVWYNQNLKSKNYIVPGLIAVILMIIAALLTSLTIAREWENGTMEQLLSTPVRPAELVLGKLSAFFVLGIVDMLVCLLAGVFIFDVPLKGSVVLLFFSGCMFLFGALCWGIFLSAATRSQLVAYQVSVMTSFLPAFLLSGFIYSVDNMPVAIQVISYLVPARYFIVLLKGIFLKGIGLEILWFELLLLIAYAAIVFWAATRKMRQKVA